MKIKGKKYYMTGVAVWLQALLLALVSIIVLFVVAAILGQISLFAENAGEQAAYALHALLLATGCFLICRKYPKSAWYVPLVANVFVILSACFEPNFWKTDLYFWLGSALPLSVVTAYLGSKAHKHKKSKVYR